MAFAIPTPVAELVWAIGGRFHVIPDESDIWTRDRNISALEGNCQ
jgi:hypothetical protein